MKKIVLLMFLILTGISQAQFMGWWAAADSVPFFWTNADSTIQLAPIAADTVIVWRFRQPAGATSPVLVESTFYHSGTTPTLASLARGTGDYVFRAKASDSSNTLGAYFVKIQGWDFINSKRVYSKFATYSWSCGGEYNAVRLASTESLTTVTGNVTGSVGSVAGAVATVTDLADGALDSLSAPTLYNRIKTVLDQPDTNNLIWTALNRDTLLNRNVWEAGTRALTDKAGFALSNSAYGLAAESTWLKRFNTTTYTDSMVLAKLRNTFWEIDSVNTDVDVATSTRMATYTQPTGFLAATFPSGTIANTTNITAGTITTATNLTTNNDKTGYALSGTQTFNNTGTWTGGITGNVGGNVTGNVGLVLSVADSVKVNQGTKTWATTVRELTALDEDVTTLDLNATTVGTATNVTNPVTVGSFSNNAITTLAFADSAIAGIKIKTDAYNAISGDVNDTLTDLHGSGAWTTGAGADTAAIRYAVWNYVFNLDSFPTADSLKMAKILKTIRDSINAFTPISTVLTKMDSAGFMQIYTADGGGDSGYTKNAGSGATAADMWAYATRALTETGLDADSSFTNAVAKIQAILDTLQNHDNWVARQDTLLAVQDSLDKVQDSINASPTLAMMADTFWADDTIGHRAQVNSFGKWVLGLGASSLTAADIWAYATRTLTGFDSTTSPSLYTRLKTILDQPDTNLVWSVAERDSILTALTNAAIRTKVWSALLASYGIKGSAGHVLNLISQNATREFGNFIFNGTLEIDSITDLGTGWSARYQTANAGRRVDTQYTAGGKNSYRLVATGTAADSVWVYTRWFYLPANSWLIWGFNSYDREVGGGSHIIRAYLTNRSFTVSDSIDIPTFSGNGTSYAFTKLYNNTTDKEVQLNFKISKSASSGNDSLFIDNVYACIVPDTLNQTIAATGTSDITAIKGDTAAATRLAEAFDADTTAAGHILVVDTARYVKDLADSSIKASTIKSNSFTHNKFSVGVFDSLTFSVDAFISDHFKGNYYARVADNIWDELQAGHPTAGTFGKYVDTTITSRGTGSGGGDTTGLAREATLVAVQDSFAVILHRSDVEDSGLAQTRNEDDDDTINSKGTATATVDSSLIDRIIRRVFEGYGPYKLTLVARDSTGAVNVAGINLVLKKQGADPQSWGRLPSSTNGQAIFNTDTGTYEVYAYGIGYVKTSPGTIKMGAANRTDTVYLSKFTPTSPTLANGVVLYGFIFDPDNSIPSGTKVSISFSSEQSSLGSSFNSQNLYEKNASDTTQGIFVRNQTWRKDVPITKLANCGVWQVEVRQSPSLFMINSSGGRVYVSPTYQITIPGIPNPCIITAPAQTSYYIECQ